MRLEVHVREKPAKIVRIACHVPRVELVVPHFVAQDGRRDNRDINRYEDERMRKKRSRACEL